jgi:Flp pilus assembly protein TadD/ketosteroid isomerase-like protein
MTSFFFQKITTMKTNFGLSRSTAKLILRKTTRMMTTLASAGLLLMVQPVAADEASDVTRLLHSGQSAEAMVKIDAYLEKHPRDMQMRFVKGVTLTEQGKTNEAITVFTKLTEDHPDLPEPYNNLAVLFAANGQYEKARTALDMAIRTNPSYATAYENLGDIHAKLASQAYDKAFQLDSSNTNAKSKLTMLRSLSGSVTAREGKTPVAYSDPNTNATAPTPTPAPVAIPRPAIVSTAAPIAVARLDNTREDAAKFKAEVKVEPKPEPMLESKAEAKPDLKTKNDTNPKVDPKSKTKTEQKQIAKNEAESKTDTKALEKLQPKPIEKPTPKPIEKPEVKVVDQAPPKIVVTNPENESILAAVRDWAEAWSAQDVKRYLSHYAGDFEPPKGVPFKVWVEERTSRISGKGHISVKVDSPQITVSGNTATFKFRQLYVSDRLQADSRKVLVMTKQNGRWQIKQERSGG